MGPIAGIGSGGDYRPWTTADVRPALSSSLLSADAGASLDPARSAGIQSSGDIANVFAAVTELLESVGGGAENDGMLRLMISLLILLALYQQQQQRLAGVAGRALGEAVFPGGPSGSTMGIYSSSTSVSFEYTDTTVVFSGALNGDIQQMDSGATLDVTA